MREPGLIDLTNFTEDEIVLVNDPPFSREAIGQYKEKPLKQQSRSTKHKFPSHAIKEAEDSGKRGKAKCPVCDYHHGIEDCQNLKKKTLWPLFMDGVQLPQGYSHFEEAVYFLPFSSQEFLVLILSTSEG